MGRSDRTPILAALFLTVLTGVGIAYFSFFSKFPQMYDARKALTKLEYVLDQNSDGKLQPSEVSKFLQLGNYSGIETSASSDSVVFTAMNEYGGTTTMTIPTSAVEKSLNDIRRQQAMREQTP